jgi:hypothetical protein
MYGLQISPSGQRPSSRERGRLAGVDLGRGAQHARHGLEAGFRDMMVVGAVMVWICRVMPAFWASAWKNSRTSSVSKVPIFGAEKLTFQTRNGRPETSTAARVSVSSMARSSEA